MAMGSLLLGALVVFLVDKVLSKLVCCKLCGDNPRSAAIFLSCFPLLCSSSSSSSTLPPRVCPGTLEEEEELHSRGQLRPHAALRGMEP